jgi:hypothetical protein
MSMVPLNRPQITSYRGSAGKF